jgi:hypothetical protein
VTTASHHEDRDWRGDQCKEEEQECLLILGSISSWHFEKSVAEEVSLDLMWSRSEGGVYRDEMLD